MMFGQDVLKTVSGKEYKGKYLKTEGSKVLFLIEGGTLPQSVPIQTIKEILTSTGSKISFVNILTLKDGTVIKGSLTMISIDFIRFLKENETTPVDIQKDDIKSLTDNDGEIDLSNINDPNVDESTLKAIRQEALKEKCDANAKIDVMVMQLKNDYYGLSDDVIQNLEVACYNIKDHFSGLEYLAKNQIPIDELNDYHLTEIGKRNNLDYIFYGYVYKIEEPFKYISDPSRLSAYNPADIIGKEYYDYSDGGLDWDGLISDAVVAFTRHSMQKEEKERRDSYELEAGSYIYGTLYGIEIATGEKSYWFKNKNLFKF